MQEKLDVKYSIFSEAFPPDEKGERHNLLPYSSYHHYLKGITINPQNIIYKPLTQSNISEVKNLHKEWFPIDYEDNYFEKVLNNENKNYFTVGAFYNITISNNTKKEIILGLALCKHEYILDNLNYNINSKNLDEIYQDINCMEEFKQYLYCKFYQCIYIMTIGVLDEYRHMHIGSNLLNYIYNISLEIESCLAIYLHVIYYNNSAINFYSKNKFKKVKKIENYYYIDGKHYDSFVFLRIISKREKEEFKINSINSSEIKKFDELNANHGNKNISIIKIIILIIFSIFDILIEYNLNKKS